MHAEHATPGQRIGSFLSFVECVVLGFAAALHFGLQLQIGEYTFATAFLYPAGIIEGILALALLLAVILPADGSVRAGRVLGAQILTVIGLFVVQVALLRGTLLDLSNAAVYGGSLVLSLASLALIAAPATRRRALNP